MMKLHNNGFQNKFLDLLIVSARKALQDFQRKDYQIFKKDKDMVTSTDLEINQILVDQLHSLLPEAMIISEEICKLPLSTPLKGSMIWFIDPIDGTNEFINQKNFFTISVGLIDAHSRQPILGGIAIPYTKTVFYAHDKKIFQIDYKNEPRHQEKLVVIAKPPREISHAKILISNREKTDFNLPDFISQTQYHTSGSIALKLVWLVKGEFDLVVSVSPKWTWDIAAATALIQTQPDLTIIDLENLNPISFGKNLDHQIPGFVAGHKQLIDQFKNQWIHWKNQNK